MEKVILSREQFRDKVMGCWLGKNAGGTLGEPLEGKFGQDEMFDVHWYTQLQEGGFPNDDLEMQLIWLQKFLEKGPGMQAADFIDAWLDCVAYNFDEYGLSKTNMKKGLLPTVCGWHNNEFRNCMGSPIRSEVWACLCPGRPEIAARYAFEDAICDHGGGESVYGEIFNAVVQSAAFVISDAEKLIEIGLGAIPEDCLTAKSVRMAVALYKKGVEFKDARNALKDAFYNPISQYSPLNLGFQTIAWLYGSDFGDIICRAVNCGWDTDCTAATLGATLGIIHGASGLPQKWLEPLGKNICTNMTTGGIRNLVAPTNVDELTDIVCEHAVKTLRYWGVDVREEAGDAVVTAEISLPVDTSFMKDYRSDTICFRLGGYEQFLSYGNHAAIVGNAPSHVELTIRNPHMDPVTVAVAARMPEGFAVEPKQTEYVLAPGEKKSVKFTVSAPAEAIRESNVGEFALSVKGRPAIPSVPLVFVGGVHWLVSDVFHGAALESDLGVAEEKVFDAAPAGFHDEWRTGNDLQLKERLKKGDVIYLLHTIYAEHDQPIVVGVPNTGRMRIWQDGKLLHETIRVSPLRANQGNGGAQGDLANYKVTELKKGWNQFLIKLEGVVEPCLAHFTLGGMHPTCYKNHGEPVLDINQSCFPW